MRALCCLVLALLPATAAQGITRTEVMTRAKAYAYHPWRCTVANTIIPSSCSTSWSSLYVPGDYVGVAYDWGGYKTLFQFDQEIAQGKGAGSHSFDGILSCTTGVDCSGFVSKCWDIGHYTTASLSQLSQIIQQSQVLAGDAFNKAGYHVVLFSHSLANGDPIFFEAGWYNVKINTTSGWSAASGFTPLRYNKIQGASADDPAGTMQHPIAINSLPFSDSRDTKNSASDVLDGCGAAPSIKESGPEFIYKLELTQPGSLTVSVSDDVGVDIDVHLYTSMNTNDCVARANTAFTYQVDCGTYYIVADTYSSYSGSYSMQVSFSPSGQSCGSGPPAYQPLGGPGDPCEPFCNPNLNTICMYGGDTPLCTTPCNSDSECSFFAGGCCRESYRSEKYCYPSNMCITPHEDAGAPSDGTVGDQLDALPALDGAVGVVDGLLGSRIPALTAPNGEAGKDLEENGFQCRIGSSGPGSDAWVLLLLLYLGARRSRKSRSADLKSESSRNGITC